MNSPDKLFTKDWTEKVFPASKSDDFFEALFGGSEEGAYDISLRYVKSQKDEYEFSFDLSQRPGKCLACNLTYGLPQVFSRHPIINVKGIVSKVAEDLGKDEKDLSWELLSTRENSAELHTVPFIVKVK